jgi:hypothetical protein
MDASPVISKESENNRMFRPMSLPRLCVSLALLSAQVSPALAFSHGTREQRLACTSDALRLCSAFIPNADEITTCLRKKNAELSDACRTAFEAAMNQLPGGSYGTGAYKPEDKGR